MANANAIGGPFSAAYREFQKANRKPDAENLAEALDGLLRGIDSDLVTVDTVADETWAYTVSRARKALTNYRMEFRNENG